MRALGPKLAARPFGARWSIHLRRRQGRPWWRRIQLVEDALQGADARRERVAIALDDIVKLLGKSGGFGVCQVKVHGPDMGSGSAGAKAEAGLPAMLRWSK